MNVPKHVAVIMDGNRRWAQEKRFETLRGHHTGVMALEKIIGAAVEGGIHYLTAFCFGKDNWKRSKSEVRAIFDLVQSFFEKELPSLIRQGIRVRFLGDRNGLSEAIQKTIDHTEVSTARGRKLDLVLALNFSGQWEITNAMNRLVFQSEESSSTPIFTEEDIRNALPLNDIPPPDLLIRTGGQKRISNFYLWNLAYTEIFFSDTLWPDFDGVMFSQALKWFEKRMRTYGGNVKEAT